VYKKIFLLSIISLLTDLRASEPLFKFEVGAVINESIILVFPDEVKTTNSEAIVRAVSSIMQEAQKFMKIQKGMDDCILKASDAFITLGRMDDAVAIANIWEDLKNKINKNKLQSML